MRKKLFFHFFAFTIYLNIFRYFTQNQYLRTMKTVIKHYFTFDLSLYQMKQYLAHKNIKNRKDGKISPLSRINLENIEVFLILKFIFYVYQYYIILHNFAVKLDNLVLIKRSLKMRMHADKSLAIDSLLKLIVFFTIVPFCDIFHF